MKTITCIWPATLVEANQRELFNTEMSARFGRPCRYIESIDTNPVLHDDEHDKANQCRTDVFFEIDDFDISALLFPFAMLGILPIVDMDDEFLQRMREKNVYSQEIMEKYFTEIPTLDSI